MTMLIFNFKFITHAGGNFRQHQHEMATVGALHRMAAAIPLVKVTDQTDTAGIGCIDGKTGCRQPFAGMVQLNQLGAKLPVQIFRLMLYKVHRIISLLGKLIRVKQLVLIAALSNL